MDILRVLRIIKKSGRDLCYGFLFKKPIRIFHVIKRKLIYGEPLITGPVNLSIAVSNDCNYKCLYCFEHSPFQIKSQISGKDDYLKAQMDMSVFKKLVDDISDLGTTKSICIPGRIGEPFLNPHFIEMLHYLKSKGLKSYVTTNGSLINLKQAEDLVDLGIEELYFSLGAGNAQTFQKLMGAPQDYFDKVINTVKSVVDYKRRLNRSLPKILLTNVICKMNYLEVVDMTKIATQTGVDGIGFYKMYFCAKRKKIIESFILGEKEIEKIRVLLLEASALAAVNNLQTNIPFFTQIMKKDELTLPMDYKRRAARIRSHVNILADGLVYAEDYPELLGNINKISFMNIWYGSNYIDIRRRAGGIVASDETFPCYSACRCCDSPLYKMQYSYEK